MNITIFGLSITSSWGNGHATIWRGICKALANRGHNITFFERDVPYYAERRDLVEFSNLSVVLYDCLPDVLEFATRKLRSSDVGIVTSYCPDAVQAADMICSLVPGLHVFYDLDTPITIKAYSSGNPPEYLPAQGLSDFDIVLSYTGGEALQRLQSDLGAKYVVPLYGCVDPETHAAGMLSREFLCDFSYLGTYAADRQTSLEKMFIEPAKQLPDHKFILGGALYPIDFPWQENIWYLRHVAPSSHSAFYGSSGFTLNITRKAMAEMGYCPSGRLFEAAACGTPVISDYWEGLDFFFEPETEICIARRPEDVIELLHLPNHERQSIGDRFRKRALSEHTADHRAKELESIFLLHGFNSRSSSKLRGSLAGMSSRVGG